MVYSRRQTVEEKNNKRKAIGFVLLSIGFIMFMIFYGLKILVNVSSFFYDFKKSNQSIEINDKTPPPPPKLDSLPSSTNKQNINLQGSAEAGSSVSIDVNGNSSEVVADNDGRFSTNIDLDKGDNYIKATAKDTAGNVSSESQSMDVKYDTDPPKLEITSPADNSQFYGSTQKTLNITGTTEDDAKVQINDRLAIVNSDGKFSFSVTLQNGDNNFVVKSTDEADNTTEVDFKVTYSP